MRPASAASSLWASAGTSSRTARKWRCDTTNSVQSVSHSARAVRGPWSSSDSSPTMAPSPRVAILRPLRLTATVPSTTTNASWPVWPWSTSTVPAVILISSPDRAMSSSSLRVHAAKSGTLFRWSTYAFLLAIVPALYAVRVTRVTAVAAPLLLALVLDRLDGRRGRIGVEVRPAAVSRPQVPVEVVAQRDAGRHVEPDHGL